MITGSLRFKVIFIIVLTVLFWQTSKLWSSYSENTRVKKIFESAKENTQQILITVYYEALCPDSRNFIIKQLVPTFESLEDYIEVQLIPYGKAETIVTSDDYVFKCQHGELECEANIVHACSINKITDSRKSLELIACMIRNNLQPFDILESCAGGLDEYKTILNCAQSNEGRRLLAKYGEVTNDLNPKVNFIPTITLDNEFDNQILILKNLMNQVCQRLLSPPKICDS
ncbi:gamma-interferon-inducible lysosomal thiol reductase-like [Phymastichus coffea]|uniref:gamma-interferon-inducible lysosomal thiol reductase-like n=1 Tax=Phymastichus coffea TaxID=108790 RepID=UPI00273B7961|nr:gamma-interferon-inducible lysosomal thiol reductase-like [Phymastichus coffea]